MNQPVCELRGSILAQAVVVEDGGVVVAIIESGLEGVHVARRSELSAIHPTHPAITNSQKTFAVEIMKGVLTIPCLSKIRTT